MPTAAIMRVLQLSGLQLSGFTYSAKLRKKIGTQIKAAIIRGAISRVSLYSEASFPNTPYRRRTVIAVSVQ